MIARFFSQAWLNAKARQAGFNFAQFIVYRVGISISTLIMYVLVARHAAGGVYDLTPWVIGNAFALCIYECVFNVGSSFNTERFNGRLRAIMVSPTSKLTVIMYNSISSIVITTLTIISAFIAGGLIFGISFSELNIAMFALSIFVAAFTCVGLGLLLGVFSLITDSMHMVLNVLALLMVIFSGANFPVSQLPIVMQLIANVFPLYRSVRAANMSMGGVFDQVFGYLLMGELILGIVFYLTAFALTKFIERTAIRKATLEMF